MFKFFYGQKIVKYLPKYKCIENNNINRQPQQLDSTIC